MKIIPLNNSSKELKEKIRKVIKEHLNTNDDIHVSVVYYEVNTYRKPLKKGKKNVSGNKKSKSA